MLLHAESTGDMDRHERRSGDNSPIRMITQSFADDVVVNAKELAQALRVSRWTVARWREEGYQFEFGNRSTPGHLKAWLRQRATQGKTKVNELASKLARLR
ncbi:MAG: hypothetical protein QOH31_574 [Verrucomicrobiota bacterium]